MKHIIKTIIVVFIFSSFTDKAISAGNALASACKVDCLFGNCECSASGTGHGCVCICVWGFPVCGAGGGGKGSFTDNQFATFQVFLKLVTTFNSEPSLQLLKDLETFVQV